jgi:hypothetical protein
MARHHPTHDGPLCPRPATVDQTDLAEAPAQALVEIVPDDRGDVPRLKGVEIERVLDGQDNRRLPLRPRALRLVPPHPGSST